MDFMCVALTYHAKSNGLEAFNLALLKKNRVKDVKKKQVH